MTSLTNNTAAVENAIDQIVSAIDDDTHGDAHVVRERGGQRLCDSQVEVHHHHLASALRGEPSAERRAYPVGASRDDDDLASR